VSVGCAGAGIGVGEGASVGEDGVGERLDVAVGGGGSVLVGGGRVTVGVAVQAAGSQVAVAGGPVTSNPVEATSPNGGWQVWQCTTIW
jgi:hypothetical protein